MDNKQLLLLIPGAVLHKCFMNISTSVAKTEMNEVKCTSPCSLSPQD